jgi:hypothetical protein
VVTVEKQALDVDKLMQFVFRAVDEVGATLNTALVVMGDKLGLYRAMAGAGAAPDGTWMIVEPAAVDRVEDNLNPVGRAYYGLSTLLCTRASL